MITVNVKGQTLQFPDWTPDAVIDATVKRDFFSSVADKASQHIAGIQAGRDVPAGGMDPNQGSFVQGVRNTLPSPSDLVKGAVDSWIHPIDSASGIINNVVSGAKDQFGKTVDSARKGNLMEAAGHGLATVLPIVGPAAAHAGEQIAQGNIAQGLGEGAGLVGQVLAPSALAGAASKLSPMLGRALERGAGRQMQSVVDPQNLNPQMAAPVAQEMVADSRTMRAPQQELGPYLDAKANAVDTATPILNRTMPAPADPIMQALRDARSNLFDANGTVRHGMQPIVDGLSQLEKEIEAKADVTGNIPNAALKNLHQDLNYGFDPSIQNNPDRWGPDMHGAKAVRDMVNQDPSSAAANAQKSSYINAARTLPENAAKDTLPTKGQVAKTLAVAAAGELVNAAAPVLRPVTTFAARALDAGGATKLIVDAVRSPAYKTRSALIKNALGKALAAKDYDAAGAIARGIIALGQAEKTQ